MSTLAVSGFHSDVDGVLWKTGNMSGGRLRSIISGNLGSEVASMFTIQVTI